MRLSDWSVLAAKVADQARHNRRHIQRGAFTVRVPGSGSEVVAAFGNDNCENEGQARLALVLLRHALDEAGLGELGFGLSADESCWALLVRPGGPGGVGLLARFLEEAAREAWRIAGLATSSWR